MLRSALLTFHTFFHSVPHGYNSMSAFDAKYGRVLALRGALLCDQGIRLITGRVTAMPSFSKRGMRFVQREGGGHRES